MMIDWGLGPARQSDLLGFAGSYIDLAKIATGTSRLYSEDQLRAKLDLYKQHEVRPFLGGQFQEYVYATQGADALPIFLDEAVRVGFEVVEISDNCVPLSPTERRAQISMARDRGLTVFGEVGSKTGQSDPASLVSQAGDCYQAGAELVLVEGAEIAPGGRANMALISALRDGLDLGCVLFELPGPWISDTSMASIHDLKKFLVEQFGPDVNLANVMPDDIIETEALRVGLGVVGPKP